MSKSYHSDEDHEKSEIKRKDKEAKLLRELRKKKRTLDAKSIST